MPPDTATDAAMRRAILAQPDDDGPRLLYADWLDEQGDSALSARAAFIRLQCRLARATLSPAERSRLRAEARALYAAHAPTWLGALARAVDYRQFERGFLAYVELTGKRLQRWAEALSRVGPISVLRVSPPANTEAGRESVANAAIWRWIGALEITSGPHLLAFLRKLADSPHLAGLRTIHTDTLPLREVLPCLRELTSGFAGVANLSIPLTLQAGEAAGVIRYQSLRDQAAAGAPDDARNWLRALAQTPGLSRLRAMHWQHAHPDWLVELARACEPLDLDYLSIPTPGLTRIVGAPIRRVKFLRCMAPVDIRWNGSGTRSEPMAESPLMRTIDRLSLEVDDESERPLRLLLGASRLPSLRWLTLQPSRLLTDPAFVQAESWEALRGLRQLQLQRPALFLRPGVQRRLARQLEQLERLELVDATQDEMIAWFDEEALPALRQLTLNQPSPIPVSLELIHRLTRAAFAPQLQSFSTIGLLWDAERIRWLVRSWPVGAQLEELRLESAHVDDAALAELLRAEFLPRLRKLRLPSNEITYQGLCRLADCADLAYLEELDLRGNALHHCTLRPLAESRYLQGLDRLRLSGRGMQPPEMKRLNEHLLDRVEWC